MNSLIASSLFTTAALAEATTWTPDATLNTKVISDPQLSPDNMEAAFVATDYRIVDEKGFALSRVYKNEAPITAPNAASMQPRWSPDGKTLAYVSKENGLKKLYLLDNSTHQSTLLTQGLKDVQTYSWSHDGQKIAFVMEDEKCSNTRLYVYDFSKKTCTPITPADYSVKGLGDFGTTNTEFDWSPDSKKIAFAYTTSPGLEAFYVFSNIGIVDLDSNEIRYFKSDIFESTPRFSPGGNYIAYTKRSGNKLYGLTYRVSIRTVDGKEEKMLAATPNSGSSLSGPNLLGWNKDGSGVFFFEPKNTKFDLYLVPIDGSTPTALIQDRAFVREPALSADKSAISFVKQAPDTAPEAYFSTLKDFNPIKLSSVNESMTDYPIAKTEKISWDSEGLTIEGLLTYPKDFQPGNKYPLLLIIHGGPMGVYEESYLGIPFAYPISVFSDDGYFVLRTNPRGSTGYGPEFRHANFHDWGGKDMNDILRGVDYVISQGFVDEERMGVMGWSYGGYMTAWIISQTNRFKAASMGAGISNISTMKSSTDLTCFISDCMGEDEELYKLRSPITYVKNVTTPCLIQHGTDDKRVPPAQAHEWFNALEKEGKVANLLLYPGMGHRIPNTELLKQAMQSNVEWFNHYLK